MNQRQLAELVEVDSGPMQRMFADYGVRLEISNGGHHWRFYLFDPNGPEVLRVSRKVLKFAEWWPSSGKLALDRDYKAIKRADTALEAERILGEFFKFPQPVKAESKWLESAAIFDEPDRFMNQLELGDTPPFDL